MISINCKVHSFKNNLYQNKFGLSWHKAGIIAKTLLDLEMNSDLKSHLRELHITAAKEVEVGQGKKAIVIFMPVPQVKAK